MISNETSLLGLTRNPGTTIDDVIERLRGSKKETDDALFAEGESVGYEWAAREAEARELERLLKAEDCEWGDEAHWQFLRIIDPEQELDSDAFWPRVLDSYELPDAAFVEGFAKGALRLWREVRNRV